MARDRLLVHERPVRAAEILEDVVVALSKHPGVAARDRGVVDHDHVVGQPSDGDGMGPNRAFLHLTFAELQNQPGHLILVNAGALRSVLNSGIPR
jgi:hypothetical protein